MNAKSSKLLTLFLALAGIAGSLTITGCNGCGSSNTQAPIVSSTTGADPADANLATAAGNPANYTGTATGTAKPTRVAGTSQSYQPEQQGESYPSVQQAPAPIVQGQGYDDPNTNQQAYDQGYANGEAVMQADQAPPPLPEYDQPPAPDDNDIWTPGYWGYANTGYYWSPGAWVSAPYYGALWTPGYWGWYGGHYRFNHGYWGRHIGFYGGINYGYGYIGTGYYGGYWNNDHFYYNRAVTHVSPRVQTVYERPVVVNNIHYTSITNNRISFNGGRGGVEAQPRPYEVAAMHEQHMGPLPAQQQFHQQAAANRANFFNENHGRPQQAAFTQAIQTQHVEAPAERGGFGRPGAPAPNNNPAFAQHNVPEQGRGFTGQQGANAQAEQQRNLQMQQHNLQMQQQNTQLEQQRNAQALQQHNAETQQRNLQPQQQNNVSNQHQADETAQRNALQQQHQQQQFEQQRNTENQQHNQQEQQRSFQTQPQQHSTQQPRPQPQVLQQHIQPQQQHVEQPRPQPQAQPQPQHIEQPRPQPQAQPQPHVEQHAAPAQHAEAPHAAPQGAGGHPEERHPR